MTDANPSPVMPSPAKPCASAALLPSPRTTAPPAKARRDIANLSFIGKNLHQARRLHTRQFYHGNERRQQRSRHRHPHQLEQLQRKDVKRQPPPEGLHIPHPEQAPRP